MLYVNLKDYKGGRLDFKFKKHPKYNLSDERLEYLNSMINNRVVELINIIEAKLKENK